VNHDEITRCNDGEDHGMICSAVQGNIKAIRIPSVSSRANAESAMGFDEFRDEEK